MENQKAYVEIEKENYPIICLYKHEGLDLANMTCDEFIKTMSEDLMKAQANYEELMAEPMRKARAEYLERERDRHTKFAQSKWKTEKRQNKYIEEEMKKSEECSYYTKTESIFFDLKPDRGNIGIAGVCILKPNDTERKLKFCFEEIKDSKYFKCGFGWAFRYEAHSKDYPASSFRPYIDILLPEELEREQKQDEENLNESVAKFYEGCRYCGD